MSTFVLYSLTVLIWGSSLACDPFSDRCGSRRLPSSTGLFWLPLCLLSGVLREAYPCASHLATIPTLRCWDQLILSELLAFYYAAFDLATGLLAVIFSTMTVMNIFNSALFSKTQDSEENHCGGHLRTDGHGAGFLA